MGKESKPQKTPKMTYFVNFYTGKKSKRTNKTPSRIEEFRACTLYSAMKQADAARKLDPDSLEGRLPLFLPDVHEVREDFADYLGECLAVDHGIGILLEELTEALRAVEAQINETE